jgi:5-formyltetrahydrofolate cyclo-ligase
MNKKELRKSFLQKRIELDDAHYHSLNQQLCKNFFSHVPVEGKMIHIYIPIAKNKEPDTWTIIKHIIHEYKGTKIVLPRILDTNGSLQHFAYDSNTKLVENKWGIPEPEEGERVLPASIDTVVIPLLAYDEQGHRVGYGKGFYDKFLSTCRPDVFKAGLSFFPPVAKIDDVGKHDQRLDVVITPDHVFSFT